MCQFCTEHGEGKKWYLQMKNYSKELLQAELSADQQALVGASTRLDWNNAFWKGFVMPAIIGVEPAETDEENTVLRRSAAAISEDELVRRRQVEHFGQGIPIEDVEQVVDMADSITRMPCGCRFMTTGKADK